MAILRVPLNHSLYHYEFRVELGSMIYVFEIRYNTYMGTWIFSIYDSANDPIIMGLPLLVGIDLLRRYTDDRLPPGRLFMYNLENNNQDGEEKDLGDNLLMLYLEDES